jgi:hypothetical protein
MTELTTSPNVPSSPCCTENVVRFDLLMESLGRKGLRKRGRNIRHHDYVAYMEAFIGEKKRIIERLYASNITASTIRYKGLRIDDDILFEMRTADKRLMLDGDFDPNKMIPVGVSSSDFSAPSQVHGL